MITKMKKLTFLVYHKEYEAFLNGVRELGVVHVAEKLQGIADNTELQDSIRLSSRLQSTLKMLQGYEAKDSTPASADRGLEVLEEVDLLQSEKAKLQQQLQNYQKERAALEPWGDFEPESLVRLHNAGLTVNFYSCSENMYDEGWEEAYNALIISKVSSRIYFIIITKSTEEIDLDAEQVKLPPYSLSRVQILCREVEQSLADNDQKMALLAEKEQPSLRAALKEVNTDMEFSKVLLNTERTAGEKLMLLQGWAPASREKEIAAWLEQQNVYYEITTPTPEDNVPIQLNNKGFFAWFEPVCKLYMLPKYSELDLTPFFAPFFMVFFGLCLGDSGYGLFLFLGATLYRLFAKNISATMKPILSLVQVLAVSTFFCGMLTGTFFGVSLYDLNMPFLQEMKKHLFMDNNNMFQLSLILGVIQILFGMVLKAVNQAIQFGFRYAVATIGWIILLVSCGVGALLPGVMPLGGTAHLCILGAAAAMIFLYNSPGKNIFLNIGLGLWDSYNMATGLLGDVLSYVRLFALGLSGGILAGVFNSLAVGMSPDNIILGPIVMVLIFVIGHAINIFMNVLGAMVHPMRLTFVEFFKNSGYEGGGKEYKPFKK
ncbi:V-type ATP synthase subunit I [Bacteroides sp. UBA939]|uniref:V-type ATP synthase subunit I n=1 Tax=Bacteroides sp. UBA939 TaxID=1946092 RepID=UPI0025C505A4|nr:V-type ATPase 116kDa subunit family protein [Bacteroides sp. UBA939]